MLLIHEAETMFFDIKGKLCLDTVIQSVIYVQVLLIQYGMSPRYSDAVLAAGYSY